MNILRISYVATLSLSTRCHQRALKVHAYLISLFLDFVQTRMIDDKESIIIFIGQFNFPKVGPHVSVAWTRTLWQLPTVSENECDYVI